MADANGGREPSCNRSGFAPETAVCKQKEERPFPGCRPEMERDLLTQTSGDLKGTEFFLAAGCPSATDFSKAEPDVSVSDAQNLISSIQRIPVVTSHPTLTWEKTQLDAKTKL